MPKGPPDAFQLQAAVGRGNAGRVAQALAAGVEPNGIRSFPLINRAVSKGLVDIVRLLVAAGADLERPDLAGWTPLTRADADDQHECVEVLLAAGADPGARTRHGFTPLHRAARFGRADDCRSLLREGHDVNAPDRVGRTAADLAFEDWSPEDQEVHDVIIGLIASGVSRGSVHDPRRLEQVRRNIADGSSPEHHRVLVLRALCDETIARHRTR